MPRFTVHVARLAPFGIVLGTDELQTDDEAEVRFTFLNAALSNQGGPIQDVAHIHDARYEGESKRHDEDADEKAMQSTTSLFLASAVTGESYDTWRQRAADFVAEHDGEDWDGLHWNTDTRTVELMFTDGHAEALATAKTEAAALDDDDEFARWLDEASERTSGD